MNRYPTPVATFSSADPNAYSASFSGEIDWGDGTKSAGTINDNGNGYYYVTGSHTYTQASTFDADGNPVPFVMRVDVWKRRSNRGPGWAEERRTLRAEYGATATGRCLG